jgi:hypothetical protein
MEQEQEQPLKIILGTIYDGPRWDQEKFVAKWKFQEIDAKNIISIIKYNYKTMTNHDVTDSFIYDTIRMQLTTGINDVVFNVRRQICEQIFTNVTDQIILCPCHLGRYIMHASNKE